MPRRSGRDGKGSPSPLVALAVIIALAIPASLYYILRKIQTTDAEAGTAITR
ncbi:hypothetical protein [Pectobacterium sp. B2J-2]|uniref:hypothetical protein n=1 Tax=Pectobacterium sp. B2J-2 TaxID=3385372 RepID=UPI0038FCCE7E